MREDLRRLLPPLLFASLLASAALTGRARPARQEEEIVPHRISERLHWLEGPGGNVAVLAGEDGLLMVDDKFDRNAPAIEVALRELGGEAPLRFLVNTHWHGDHTGGNAVFGAVATVVAHENVRRRLAGDASLGGRVAAGTPPAALPEVTFEDALVLHFAGERVRVDHYPKAHTDGDAVVTFERAKVVHMGDLFFHGRFPFIDLGSGGSVEGFVASVAQVLDSLPEGEVTIVPGHGPLATRADLEGYLGMLRETSERVRAALAEGRTMEDMRAGGLLDDWAEEWSWGFVTTERFLETLVTDLGRGR